MPGWVPLPQGFAHPRRNPRHDEDALRGNETAGESGSVRDFRFALGQVGDIDVVKDGKAGQLRGGIGGDDVRGGDEDERKKREKAHGFLTAVKRKSFTSFHLEEGTSIP